MLITIIVAYTTNRVIGSGNLIPWKLKGDMAHFRQVTWGSNIIMGRKTFDSIGRPLTGRRNIIITRSLYLKSKEVTYVSSFRRALEKCAQEKQVYVIGGSEIYNLALPWTERIIATELQIEVKGDAFFPTISHKWREVSRYPQTSEFGYSYDFVTYESRQSN